jgi:hypothetical protein
LLGYAVRQYHHQNVPAVQRTVFDVHGFGVFLHWMHAQCRSDLVADQLLVRAWLPEWHHHEPGHRRVRIVPCVVFGV